MEKGAMSACSPEPNVAALVPDGEQSSIRAVASESSDGSTTHGFGRRNKRSNRSGVDTPLGCSRVPGCARGEGSDDSLAVIPRLRLPSPELSPRVRDVGFLSAAGGL